MLELLRNLDNSLFIAINHLPHNLFFDGFFGFITAIGYAGLVWVVIAGVLAFRNKKIAGKLLTAIVWAQVLYFFLVEFLIKNFFCRLRPQFLIPGAILPYDFSRSFSFPSGHAAIAFALSYILAQMHKKRALFYYFLAVLVSFSRIYLGKHFPSDILAGALLGGAIGYISLKIQK